MKKRVAAPKRKKIASEPGQTESGDVNVSVAGQAVYTSSVDVTVASPSGTGSEITMELPPVSEEKNEQQPSHENIPDVSQPVPSPSVAELALAEALAEAISSEGPGPAEPVITFGETSDETEQYAPPMKRQCIPDEEVQDASTVPQQQVEHIQPIGAGETNDTNENASPVNHVPATATHMEEDSTATQEDASGTVITTPINDYIELQTRNDIVFLVVGDTHYMASRQQETDVMSKNVLAAIDKLLDVLDAVVLLGDILDRFHWKNLKDATNWMWQIRKRKTLYTLVGNHDRPDHSHFLTPDHPFTAMMHWENTHIVWKAEHFTLHGMGFFMIPYVPDGRFMEAISTIPNYEHLLEEAYGIFAHQTFYKAKMNNITSSTGDRWDISAPVVISGHIHEYAWLQANVLYTGSAYQIKHGEPENNAILIARFRQPTAPTLSPFQVRIKIHVHTSPAAATHKHAQMWQFQRVSIHVPVKRTEMLDLGSLDKYKCNVGDDVAMLRLVLRATRPEIMAARASTALKLLIRNPKVVIKYDIVDSGPHPSGAGVGTPRVIDSFLVRLKKLSVAKGFDNAYKKVFGLDETGRGQEKGVLNTGEHDDEEEN